MQDDEASKESADSAMSSGRNFMPFQVRPQMRLAPCVRHRLDSSDLDKLENILSGAEKASTTYLKELKSGKRAPKSSSKTWPKEEKVESDDDDDDVMIVGKLRLNSQ